MRDIRTDRRAFTILEVIVMIGILALFIVIAVPKFAFLARQTREGDTKGKLGVLRSALSLYAADNGGRFPTDRLESLAAGGNYLKEGIPVALVPDYHDKTSAVVNNADLKPAALEANDRGGWSYWNDRKLKEPGYSWGALWIGCTHTDSAGSAWTLY